MPQVYQWMEQVHSLRRRTMKAKKAKCSSLLYMRVLPMTAYQSLLHFAPDDLADVAAASALQHCQTLTETTMYLVFGKDIEVKSIQVISAHE